MLENDVPLRPCPGCRGLVPDVDGPVHAYMHSSPGCWRWYGEVTALSAHHAGAPPEVRSCLVDCFAVQHPGGADTDRRQRGSVAVHLISLCLVQEFGLAPGRMSRVRQTMSATVLPRMGLDAWPYLPPPSSTGTVTVAEARAAVEGDAFDEAVRKWAVAAWRAWEPHHQTVRACAEAALDGSRRW